MTQAVADHEFSVQDKVVYPAHGVGQIAAVETQTVAGMTLEVYVVTFDHEKMTLRVPTKKAKTAGLRHLAPAAIMNQALTTLKGRARIKRTMWSRRAQEYEAKINSGDVIAISEVVRDLYKNVDSERSYSERTIYESALSRLSKEISILENIGYNEAKEKLVELLKEKSLDSI